MFYLDFLPKLNIKQVSVDGKRCYSTPEGNVYASVTTVISKMADKRIIENWRKRIGEQKADKITKSSAARGTKIHSLIEELLLGKEIDYSQVLPINRMMFNQLRPILEKNVSKIYGIEFGLYSDILKTAGRTDLIADYQGEPALIDFKTAKREKKKEWIKNYFLQETTYACCLLEKFDFVCKKIVTIIATEDGIPQVFIEKPGPFIKDVVHTFKSYHRLNGDC